MNCPEFTIIGLLVAASCLAGCSANTNSTTQTNPAIASAAPVPSEPTPTQIQKTFDDQLFKTVEKIVANGGSVRVPPFDAPGVGRMSMVMDPSGANFSIIQFVQA